MKIQNKIVKEPRVHALTVRALTCQDSGQLPTGGNIAMYGVEMMGRVLQHVLPSISGCPSWKFELEVHTSTSKNRVTINNKLQFEYLMKTNAIFIMHVTGNLNPNTNGHIDSVGGRRRIHWDDLPVSHLQIWKKVRIQTTAYYHPHNKLVPYTNAAPPSTAWPFGQFDSVIFNIDPSKKWPQSGLPGKWCFKFTSVFDHLPCVDHMVANICLIFWIMPSAHPFTGRHITHWFLAYVWYSPPARPCKPYATRDISWFKYWLVSFEKGYPLKWWDCGWYHSPWSAEVTGGHCTSLDKH